MNVLRAAFVWGGGDGCDRTTIYSIRISNQYRNKPTIFAIEYRILILWL